MAKQAKNTWLFIGFLFLAGFTNLIGRTLPPEWDALTTCIQYVTYTGLLIFWMEAVRVRLLPSRARRYIVCAACLMLGYMMLRFFKYCFAVTVDATRYASYAYWIPQMLIPALLLMTCIYIRYRGKTRRRNHEVWLLLPAVLLALLVMTNDIHSLVYIPHVDLSQFILETGTYNPGPGFLILYAWMVLTSVSGIVLLFREAGRMPKKTVVWLAGDIVLWVGLVLLNVLVIDKMAHPIRTFNVPEVHVFCMLGVFEICIRNRLIPYNENYTGFFHALQMPVWITDRNLQVVYASGTALPAEKETLKAALDHPVVMEEDLKLSGMQIHAGYAFWAEDESSIHRAWERLEEANDTIEHENDLLRAETQQKEENASLQSRHRIYHEIAGKLYPVQKKITRILEEAVPGTDAFREKIAQVSVLNAYVKRKTNLLLLAAEQDAFSKTELFLLTRKSCCGH